jgi:hypothetical protein
MKLLRNAGLPAALFLILIASPAWCKSFNSAASFFTETGRLDPEYVSAILSYSPLFILLDIASSLFIIYYFKKFFKHGMGR